MKQETGTRQGSAEKGHKYPMRHEGVHEPDWICVEDGTSNAPESSNCAECGGLWSEVATRRSGREC